MNELTKVPPVTTDRSELQDAILRKLLQRRMEAHAASRDARRITPADRSAALPVSYAQQRLWFLDRLDAAAGAAYHMPVALRLSGALQRQALKATLDGLVRRHEILRTRFGSVDGQTVQWIDGPEVGFQWQEVDLSGLEEPQRTQAVQRLSEQEQRAPFDLARGPLIRGQLLKLEEQEHILLLTQHHIISDGWSTGIMVREVSALYEAYSQGREDPLEPLTIQYADYAVWQRQWLQGEVLRQQTQYWKEQLGGAPALLELPTDRPRPAEQSYEGGQWSFEIPAQVSAGLQGLAQSQGATLFMTLLAGWAVLLSRLSGQKDIVVGTPVANRQRSEVEGLIGFFVNTLALRVRLEDDPTVQELLQQVKASTLDAYEHQDLPFEQVVEALQPQRSLSHSPLFQNMLSLNNTPAQAPLQLSGLRITVDPQSTETTHFDLSLSINEYGGRLFATMSYARDLFERETIGRWADLFLMILKEMISDAGQRVGAIDWLGPKQRRQVLQSFNDTVRAYPQDALVHSLFEAQVRARPQATALVYEQQQLSYGELNERANQVAHRLVQLGIRPDDRVAICMQRSVEMVVGLLGILKSGAAYVPLDPAYPAARLAYMLGDSEPGALLTQQALVQEMRQGVAIGVPVLALDGAEAAQIEVQPRHDPDPQALGLNARHLAYIIYTSGSTGQPKGVMIEHRGVVNLWQALARDILAHLPSGARFALNASMAFDASVKIIVQLLSGHGLILIPALLRMEGQALLQWIEDREIDVLDCTPAQLEMLGSAGMLTAARQRPLTLLIGGDAIAPATWRALAESRDLQACNVYGPTECTVDATAVRIQGEHPHIGRPIANTRIYILDGQGRPVPIGVVGEIHIGGHGVARGYWKRPDLTQQRFVEDGFSGEAGARLYKTGDLGRWLADGNIEYLGRNDHQVKIRGFRIELGEIEARLVQCPGVREAVVVAREDQGGDKRLVAYVSAQEGAQGEALAVSALRSRLAEALADYMVPSAFVVLAGLPLTPNGKIDRQALPAPEAGALVSQPYEAPADPLEQRLAQIWQELLGVERVGRHDNFFELGGHSLLAVRVIVRVRQELGVESSLRALFNQPELAAFAKSVEQAGASLGQHLGQRITPADRSGVLPVSYAQQRLWFLDRLDAAAGAAYHMPVALRLSGALQRQALKATLDGLVRRHEILRTRFGSVDGQTVQWIDGPEVGFQWQEVDLSGLEEPQRTQAVQSLSQEEQRAPFDLARGPLIRGQLLKLEEQAHILLLTQHHIISDGWSTGIMVREVSALYEAYSQGREDPLEPLTIQYADYAVWQRQWLQGEVLRQQTQYWKEQLGGAPALLELPTDRPRPAEQSYEGGQWSFEIPAQVSAGLQGLAQSQGATLFMTLLAGWAVLLSRLSGQKDIVVGTPVANRQRSEVEGLIGFFVNTLALRVRLEDDPTVQELLQQVKASTLDAYEHQDLPFEQVVEALQPQRSLSHSPLFQNMLSLNNTPVQGPLQLSGLSISTLAPDSGSTQFDLSLALSETPEGLSATLSYASALYEPSSIQRLEGYLQAVLRGLVEDPTQRVSELALLSAAQRRQVLEEFNATARAYPQDELIHELFEEQVRARPQATALVYEQQQLSYGELNERANQVAHRLVQLGIRPDDRVAICMQRSVEMVVGLLGILKSGAAYVPLDPAYPAARLAYMLGDSEPGAVLTQQALVQEMRQGVAIGVPVLALDGAEAAQIEVQPRHDPDPQALGLNARHLAYIIYTSGSTGQPKGVMVEHAGLSSLAHAQIAQFGVNPSSRVLQFASFSFDVCISELTLALCSGASVLLAPASALAPGDTLLELVRTQGVTHLPLPKAALAVLPADAELGVLQTVIVGGEVLPAVLADAWSSRYHLHNSYGPTETTVCATVYTCRAPDPVTVPIGRPIAGKRIYILDERGNPVPMGTTGEIYIGGAGVARGYWKQPELTRQRFLPDPHSLQPGARMYRTGDLGRWLPEGHVDFLGRNDHQVKIRGFRIELGEIETRLAQCEGVCEAIVLARRDGTGDPRLVAYVTGSPGHQPAAARLRAELGQVLPEHMVPHAFVTLPAMPLTPNGKIDRAALPAPDQDALATRPYEAPLGDLEHAIGHIWQELLGVQRIGRHDNFFELGGHSLLAVRMIGILDRQFNLKMALRELFVHPTLQGFATLAGKRDTGRRYRHLVPIRTTGRQAPLFLFHPSKGEVGYAYALACHLDVDLPVYGLAAAGFAEDEQPLSSVEEMAAAYIREIRQVQPHGPYRLGGSSSGGILAYEAANQLIGADEHVEFLALIDTDSQYLKPDVGNGVSTQAPPVSADVDGWIDSLVWVPDGTSEAVKTRLADVAAIGDRVALLEEGQRVGLLPGHVGPELLKRYLAVQTAMGWALIHYLRPPLSIPMCLFAAEDEQPADPTLGWRSAVGNRLKVIAVPGTHHTMVEAPHVASLAHAIGQELETIKTQPVDRPEQRYMPAVLLKQGSSSQVPVFCVPGAGASVTALADLADALGPQITVHGLQPRGLCGILAPHVDVSSAAHAYVRALREIRPRGPVHLMGHSFGGWVALEMAHVLQELGQPAATLTLLDSSAPSEAPASGFERHSPAEALRRLIQIYEQSLGRSLELEVESMGTAEADQHLARLLARLVQHGVMPQSTRLPTLKGIFRTFSTHLNTQYLPARPYLQESYLVNASPSPGGGAALRRGLDEDVGRWEQHLPRAQAYTCGGNHMSMLRAPHVLGIAAWLQPFLTRR
ncbi:amino acid adenylation domain-containing protein [Roseateles sp. SL47]|uniref:non-ribosomal peptide synthetase n=1 Tax=Roseateles sp. SL47 TaxID=2995138 RepID=UPI00226F41D7|nr:non-ribosomal peptide synthetase [Roseateles sp. SL47]WAC73173.1 amino acid adenylation domain-containing protein [Roseateles sp. SL47]